MRQAFCVTTPHGACVFTCLHCWHRRCGSVESADGFEGAWMEDGGDVAADELDVPWVALLTLVLLTYLP